MTTLHLQNTKKIKNTITNLPTLYHIFSITTHFCWAKKNLSHQQITSPLCSTTKQVGLHHSLYSCAWHCSIGIARELHRAGHAISPGGGERHRRTCLRRCQGSKSKGPSKWTTLPSWECKGIPPMPPPQRNKALLRNLLTIDFP